MKRFHAVTLAAALLSGLSLALRAQTAESAKSAVDGSFANAARCSGCVAPGIKPVCAGRLDLVEATDASLAAAEKGVALYAQQPDAKGALTVDQGVALVDENAASNSGYCVYKTVIDYLKWKGEIGSYIHTVERGDDFSLLIEDVNGGKPVVYKNAGEVADYARGSLKHYLYGVADSYQPSLKDQCAQLNAMPKAPSQDPLPDYCYGLLGLKKNPNYPWTPLPADKN